MGGWRKGTVAILWSVVVLAVGYWFEAEYGLEHMPWGALAIGALVGIVMLYAPEIRSAALARVKPEEERRC